VVPQVTPAVTREHACVCVVTTLVHVFELHVGVVTVRDCVPPSSQVLANPPQVLHAE
jgi:hypothetical protein